MVSLNWRLFFLLLFFFCNHLLWSADRFWIATAPASWNNSANWSTTSGGAGGASVPTIGDIAIFDGGGTGNCNTDISISVDGMDIRSGYTGFITQGAGFTITIGTNNFQQAAGTFAGNNSDITINGTFTLAGGTFTSTAANLILNGNQSASYTVFTYTSGTFNHNNGLISFGTNWTTGSSRTATVSLSSTINFYDIDLVFDENSGNNPDNKFLATSGANLVALNDFTHTDGVLSGTIEVRNDLEVLDDADGGLGLVLMNGSAASEYIGSSSGRTAELEIDNTMGVTPASGTTDLLISALILTNGDLTGPSGSLSIGGNRSSSYDVITQTSGTYSNNNGLLLIETNWTTGSGRTATINLSNPVDFYDVQLAFDENNGGNPNNKFLASGGMNLVVLNDFTHTDGAFNTTFEVRNDLFVEADSDGGTGRIIMNGSGPSEYTFSGAAARTAELEIDNAAGVTPASGTTDLNITALYLTSGDFTAPSGTLSIGGNRSSSYDVITQTSGTYSNNNGLLLIETNWTTGSGRTATINLSNPVDFYDVQLAFDENNGGNPNNKFLASGGMNLVVLNDFTHTDGAFNTTFEVRNDLFVEADSDGGTGRIIMNGSGPSEYTFSGAAARTAELEIDNAAGVTPASGTTDLNITALYLTSGDFTAPSGTLSIGGNRSSSYDVITQTSGTYSNNNGLLLIETNWTTGSGRTATINLSNPVDFYDVQLAFDENNGGNPNNKFLASGGMNLVVLNDFTHTDGAFNTTFEVRNDLFVEADSDGGTGRIIMNGSGPSEYTFSGAAARTAELEIDNAAGVTPASGTTDLNITALYLTSGDFTAPSGTLSIGGNRSSSYDVITQTSGTYSNNNGLLLIETNWTTGSGRTATINLSNPVDFYDVQLAFDENNGGNPNNKFLASGGMNLVVLNDFTHTDGAFNTTFEVRNDLFVEADSDGGTGRIIMNGSGPSEYTFSGAAARTAELEIDNAAGVTPASGTTDLNITALYLTSGDFTAPSGTLSIGGNRSSSYDVITQTSGTYSNNNGLLLIETNWTTGSGRTATINLSNPVDFYDVQLAFDENNGGNPNNKFLASGGMNLVVLNDFTHTDGAFNTTFEVRNDLFVEADSDGGTGRIIMNGSGPSEYTFSGAAARTAELEIDNAAGVTPASGTTDLNITALYLTSGDFTGPSGTLSIGGSRSANYDILTQTTGSYSPNGGLFLLEPNWTTGSSRTASINLATSVDFFDLTFDTQGNTSNKFFDISSGELIIGNTLDITTEIIRLNDNQITIDNGSDTAIQRTTGVIRGEDTGGQSILQWNIGNSNGTYEFPFASANNTYIPFIYNVTSAGTESGGTGSLGVATYPTAANNLPLPSGVSNINDGMGNNNSAFVIDRYWILTPGNYSSNPTADYSFTYEDSDHTTGGNTITEANLQAQRWNGGLGDWDQTSLTGVVDVSNNVLSATGLSELGIWTLVDVTSPLPVELVSFQAELVDKEVRLHWVTASEINNDFFTVQRSIDGKQFDSLSTVSGAGNSNEFIHYQAFDRRPLKGRSFYRLKQTDFDGQYEYSEIVSIQNLSDFREIDVYPNPVTHGRLNLRFEGLEGEEIRLYVQDVLGKVLQTRSIRIENQYLDLHLDVSAYASGVYYIRMHTITGIEVHKIIVD